MRVSLPLFFISIVGAVQAMHAPQANAQIDASSALMLNTGATAAPATTRETTFENGRYTIRPKDSVPPKPATPKRPRVVQEPDASSNANEGPQQPITILLPGSPTPAPTPFPRETTRVYVLPAAATTQQNVSTPPAATPVPPEAGRRFNILDLAFSPGFLYTNSDSSSFYRRYTTASPTLNVDANLWFTPSFGLHGSFLGTLSGHVNDSFNGSRNVPAAHQWFFAGIRTRKFFVDEPLSPALSFGIDYFEYEFRVPSDASLRNKLRSTGAQLSVEADLPVSARTSWTLGLLLAPKLEHREAATSSNFSSGGNVDANMIGVSLGARYQFARRDALFWKISHRIEKDLFSGEAMQNDPITGVTPSGVSVINSFTLLELGYAWGN